MAEKKSKRELQRRAGGDDGASDEREALVEESMTAWEEGDFAAALALAEEACALDKRSSAAHHCRAAALVELERLEEAQEACDAGVAVAGDDPEALLYAADFYITELVDEPELVERGVELARRGTKLARQAGDRELAADLLLAEAAGLEELVRLEEALARIDEALVQVPDDPIASGERGVVLFELCRYDEARAQLETTLRLDQDLATAHYTLGLLDERRGDERAAEQRFRRARRLAPEDYPARVRMSAKEFDAVLEAALERLPAKLRRYLANVAVTVQQLPDDEDLLAADPPHSPQTLGMFRGSPLTDAAAADPWAHFPRSIVLYQRNLERFARDREELVEQIGVTLVHEVGHFLGLDEEELRARGLD